MNVVPNNLAHKHNPRGDVVMPIKRPKQGNIVETLRLGGTTIHICDDYFAETPEEIEKILDDYHAAAWAIVNTEAAKGEAV